MKLRIATFNLENFDDKPGQKPTLQERIEVTRPQLQGVNADILCLQKVNGQEEIGQPRRLLALDAFLKDTQYVNFNRVSTVSEDRVQIYDECNLVILSRYEILEHNQYKNNFAPAPLYRLITTVTGEG